eukprot:GEMP01009531.1.p1 GENE.GEMP01009531.1~~GEMP01009531.1.p1  ORF type:complete len:1031 (+),score=265.63 GEMP01009531.1:104-3196(+)
MKAVTVACRMRPLLPNEDVGSVVVVDPTVSVNAAQGERTFSFDHAFDPETTDDVIWEKLKLNQLTRKVLDGFHTTVMAYGQTSSGKTYTIDGGAEESGVVCRAAHALFEQMQQDKDRSYVVRVSYLQLYMEKTFDLLNPAPWLLRTASDARRVAHLQKQPGLRMRKSANGWFVENLYETECANAEEVIRHWKFGRESKQMAQTAMNAHSSRSHTLFTIKVEKIDPKNEKLGPLSVSKLTVVDLAGSERPTGNTTARFQESVNINGSLFVLRKVITALVQGSVHVPYRESKLTCLLKQSIGGSSYLVMLACVNPTLQSTEESISTLHYVTQASHIQNAPKENKDPKLELIDQLRTKITHLEQYIVETLKQPLPPAEEPCHDVRPPRAQSAQPWGRQKSRSTTAASTIMSATTRAVMSTNTRAPHVVRALTTPVWSDSTTASCISRTDSTSATNGPFPAIPRTDSTVVANEHFPSTPRADSNAVTNDSFPTKAGAKPRMNKQGTLSAREVARTSSMPALWADGRGPDAPAVAVSAEKPASPRKKKKYRQQPASGVKYAEFLAQAEKSGMTTPRGGVRALARWFHEQRKEALFGKTCPVRQRSSGFAHKSRDASRMASQTARGATTTGVWANDGISKTDAWARMTAGNCNAPRAPAAVRTDEQTAACDAIDNPAAQPLDGENVGVRRQASIEELLSACRKQSDDQFQRTSTNSSSGKSHPEEHSLTAQQPNVSSDGYDPRDKYGIPLCEPCRPTHSRGPSRGPSTARMRRHKISRPSRPSSGASGSKKLSSGRTTPVVASSGRATPTSDARAQTPENLRVQTPHFYDAESETKEEIALLREENAVLESKEELYLEQIHSLDGCNDGLQQTLQQLQEASAEQRKMERQIIEQLELACQGVHAEKHSLEDSFVKRVAQLEARLSEKETKLRASEANNASLSQRLSATEAVAVTNLTAMGDKVRPPEDLKEMLREVLSEWAEKRLLNDKYAQDLRKEVAVLKKRKGMLLSMMGKAEALQIREDVKSLRAATADGRR